MEMLSAWAGDVALWLYDHPKSACFLGGTVSGVLIWALAWWSLLVFVPLSAFALLFAALQFPSNR